MIEANVSKLNLSLICLDGGTQSRVLTSQSVIDDYAEAYASGDRLPPVTVFHDGSTYWLADGFHRVAAAQQAGIEQIDATILSGTCRDAILAATGANATHGLRRSNADKVKAVKTLLADPEWSSKSNRWIAEHAKVSHTFVSKLRSESGGNVATTSRAGNERKLESLKDAEDALDDAEADIQRGRDMCLHSLKVIRDGRLYRKSHATFKKFVADNFPVLQDCIHAID